MMGECYCLCHGEHGMLSYNSSAQNSMFLNYCKLLIRKIARFPEDLRRGMHFTHIVQRGLHAYLADERFPQPELPCNYTAILADPVDMGAGVIIVGFCRSCERRDHIFDKSRIFNNSRSVIGKYLHLADLRSSKKSSVELYNSNEPMQCFPASRGTASTEL